MSHIVWLLVGLFSTTPVAAQDSAAFLVFEGAADAGARDRLSSQGIAVVNPAEGLRLWTSRVGIEAPAPTVELSTFQTEAAVGLRALANQNFAEAERVLERLHSVAAESRTAVGRDATFASAAKDVCLFLVRTYLDAGQQERARGMALDCQRLSPLATFTRTRHPPEVLEFFESTLQAAQTASVVLTESSEANCSFAINGRPAGIAPSSHRLVAGEYDIGVDCSDAPEILYRVRISTSGEIGLPGKLAFELQEHDIVLEQLSRGDLRALSVLLGHPLIVLRATERPLVIDPQVSRRADWEQAAGHVELDWAPHQSVSSAPERLHLGAGLALLGAGAISFVTGVVLQLAQVGRGDDLLQYCSAFGDAGAERCLLQADYLSHYDPWDAGATSPHLFAWGGALLAATSVPFLLDARSAPRKRWSWIGGTVGLSLAVVATVMVLIAPACEENESRAGLASCVDRSSALGRASLVGSAALPLLALPVTAALMGSSVDGSAHSVRVNVSGRF